MTVFISITLPSIHQDCLEVALANLEKTTKHEHEIIVVSPFRVFGENVVWIKESEPNGCAAAHARAARFAQGYYLFPFADDHEMVDFWDVNALDEFVKKCSPHANRPFALGLRGIHSSHVGTNYGMYYPYFPFMRRADVAKIGWICGDYRRGFGDSDLAMRVWDAGGRCEWSENTYIRPTTDDKRKETERSHRSGAAYTVSDLATFVKCWGPKYGQGWGSGIDDFNLDLRPEQNRHLSIGNTFYCNDPSFLTRAVRMSD